MTKTPKHGWRVVLDNDNYEIGRYYCPHYPAFLDLKSKYPFVRETNNGTQVKLKEEDEWEFAWDLSL